MQCKHRMTLPVAITAGQELEELLQGTLTYPCFSQWERAGSVRRQRKDPADVEIVLRPHLTRAADLWGYSDSRNSVLNEFDKACGVQLREGRLEKRPSKNGRAVWGERTKYGIFMTLDGRAIPVDLFSVIEPATWGSILAIRTGPHDFNHLLVTARALGGCCPQNRKVAGGAVWKLDKLNKHQRQEAWKIPAAQFVKRATHLTTCTTDTEEQFFEALGVPCWEPPDRTRERLVTWLEGAKR